MTLAAIQKSEVVLSANLFFREGASDKVYQCQLVGRQDGYTVDFQYGRRGSALTVGTKTASPIGLDQAKKVFEKLVKEKCAKGYTSDENGVPYQGTVAKDRDTGIRPQLLNPVDQSDLEVLLDDNDFIMQEKFDGERVMIRKRADGSISGINRNGLQRPLPMSVERSATSIVATNGETIVDGELIGERFVPFDLLFLNGEDLRDESYLTRLSLLTNLISLTDFEQIDSHVGRSNKVAALSALRARNVEGVVFKRSAAQYTSDRPNTGGPALKFKFYETCTVLVGQTNGEKRSVEMFVCDGDSAELRSVGFCTIPANARVPKQGSLIEVRYLYAYSLGALYQPTYLRERDDVECADTHQSLKFKPT